MMQVHFYVSTKNLMRGKTQQNGSYLTSKKMIHHLVHRPAEGI